MPWAPLTQREAAESAWLFLRGTLKFRALGALRIVPLGSDIVAGTMPLLLASWLSQPDAFQVATAREAGADALVAADDLLVQEARRDRLNALDPTRDMDAIAKL